MITIPFFKNPLPFFKKSSTKVSDTYIKDAAIQYYTITNSGIDLKDISIVHINNQYTKDGELDIHQLFTIESVYNQVLEFLPRIPNEVRRLKNVIESPEVPNVDIGNHCSDPMTVILKERVGNTFLTIQFLIFRDSTKTRSLIYTIKE